MRSLRFLVPGTSGPYRCGGLLVEQQTARLLSELVPTALVTYRQREQGLPFLADLLQAEPPGSAAADQ
ncbi:MAG: glycosyltransferase family 1 protein, partial [Vulcanococcus sp.]